MKLKIKKLNENVKIPSYAHEGDAGLDLTALKIIENNEQFLSYGTGVHLEIPDGFVGLIFPRSSITKKDLMLKNSVGVIDSSYRGEIQLRFFKTKIFRESWEENYYKIGEKIGQLIILPIPKINFEEVKDLSSTERGTNGFGSTGK